VPADPDDARRAAEQILSGPEYQEPSRPWWEKVLGWVDDVLNRVFGALGGSGGGAVLGWIVVVLVVVAVGVVLWLALRSRRSRRPAQGATAPARRRPRPVRVDWDARAAELEAEGRWRDGLRARYRGLVGELARRRVVDPAEARTTGEHRRQVRGTAPDAAPEFADAAELFDRAWYGGRATGAEEAERFAELSRSVRERTR
jgi:hypothetical protein